MKLIKNILVAAVAAFALISCEKQGDAALSTVVGEWYYETTESEVPVQIYISFAKDKTFELFQKVGEGAFRRYTGTYSLDGDVLSGAYSDKTLWKESYVVSRNGDILTLTGAETVSYVKKTIPATIRYHYSDALKSIAEDAVRWL